MASAQPLQTGERVYAYEFAVHLPEVCRWRWRVGKVVRDWGVAPQVVDTVELGVSELLGNVHKHVDDPRCRLEIRLEIIASSTSVRLVVRDRSPVLPTLREPDWAQDCGRGLWLLRETADDLGCGLTGDGKRVWIRCDVEKPPAIT